MQYQQRKMNQVCKIYQNQAHIESIDLFDIDLKDLLIFKVNYKFKQVTVQYTSKMFQDLKEMINRQNMAKIREKHRYGDRNHNEQKDQDPQQYSFEHQVSSRIDVFNKILDQSHQNSFQKRGRIDDYEFIKQKKLLKQIQLLEQKIRINQQMHEQQKSYLHEKYERQIELLKSSIQKHEIAKRKQVKEQNILSSLRKDNKRLLQIQNQNQSIIEKFLKEISSMKKTNIQLNLNLKKLQMESVNPKVQQSPSEQLIKEVQRAREQIVQYKRIIEVDVEKRKQLEVTIHKLRRENDQLYRDIQRNKILMENQKQNMKQQVKAAVSKLQLQNSQLKKRNQMIQESFIEHLTQTSMNLQHNIKNQFVDKSLKNTTLNLQQTPIRTRSRGKQRQRIPTPQQQQDPQKPDTKVASSNDQKIQRLTVKLQQANKKIVELLCQKAQTNFRQNKKVKSKA